MSHKSEIENRLNKIKSLTDSEIEKEKKQYKKQIKKLLIYLFLAIIITFVFAINSQIGSTSESFFSLLWLLSILLFFIKIFYFWRYKIIYKEDDKYKLLNKLTFANNSLELEEIYGIKLNEENIVIVNELKMEIFTIENSELVSIKEENKKILHIKYTKNNEVYEISFENSNLELFSLLFLRLPRKKEVGMNHNNKIRTRLYEIQPLVDSQIEKEKKEYKREAKKSLKYLFLSMILTFIFMANSQSDSITWKFFGFLWLFSILLFFAQIFYFWKYETIYEEDNYYKLLNGLIRTNNSLPIYETYGIKLNDDDIAIINKLKMEIFTIKNSELLSISEEDKSYSTICSTTNRDDVVSSIGSQRVNENYLHIEYQKENEIYDMFFKNPNSKIFSLLFSRLPRRKMN